MHKRECRQIKVSGNRTGGAVQGKGHSVEDACNLHATQKGKEAFRILMIPLGRADYSCIAKERMREDLLRFVF